MSLDNGASSQLDINPELGVVTVHWPQPERDVAELARRRIPRLFLVAPDSAPPPCTDCLEDWARLPVDDTDISARLHALAERGHSHMSLSVDEFGLLHQGDVIVFLSAREGRLAELLVTNFGSVVRDEKIEAHVFEGPVGRTTVRVQVSRLRKRVQPLGLTITCIRNVGYIMHRVDDASRATLR